jgi:hemolysin D
VIKALILNKDVGFVNPGMEATIKVDSFDFQKYGTLSGRLLQVSRDSIEDKNLGLVYEAYVQPEKMHLMVEGVETSVTTGMSVTAEIKVGKRRVIEFFIYPLIKYLDEGISVR